MDETQSEAFDELPDSTPQLAFLRNQKSDPPSRDPLEDNFTKQLKDEVLKPLQESGYVPPKIQHDKKTTRELLILQRPKSPNAKDRSSPESETENQATSTNNNNNNPQEPEEPIFGSVENPAMDQQKRQQPLRDKKRLQRPPPPLHPKDRALTTFDVSPNSREEYKLVKELQQLMLVETLCAKSEDKHNQNENAVRFERLDFPFLIRFLRGCKFNLEVARQKIRNYQNWRYAHNMNEKRLTAASLREILETGFAYILPDFDYQNRVLLYFSLGKLNFEKFSLQDYTTALYYILEKSMETGSAQRNGMQVIQEFSGFSWGKSIKVKQVENTLLDMATSRLPIRLSGVWVFNEPLLVRGLWNTFKIFLKKKMVERVHFMGAEVDSLESLTHSSNIPSELGGDLEIDYGVWVEDLIDTESEPFFFSNTDPTKEKDLLLEGIVYQISKKNQLSVKSLKSNCPAEQIGIQKGDKIVEINGHKVSSTKDLNLVHQKENKITTVIQILRVVRDVWGQRLPGYECTNLKDMSIVEDANRKWRKSMEDSHLLLDRLGDKPEYTFVGIYDGHGGDGVAKMLKDKLHLNLLREFIHSSEGPTKENITKAFTQTDREILEVSNLDSCGSTAVVAIIYRLPDRSRKLFIANCGDARAVVCHQRTATRVSFDHKPNEESEINRIQGLEGFIVRGRVGGVLSVSRSFGDKHLKKWVSPVPYVTTLGSITSDMSFIILACDGLWDVLTDQEAVDLVHNGQNAKEMAQVLKKEALRRGSQDNITVSVLIF